MTRTLDDLAWPWHTPRLELRPARAEDAHDLWAWQGDPGFARWLTTLHTDLADFRTRWEAGLPSSVVARLGGRVVGTGKIAVENGWAQAEVTDRATGTQAELGWTLDPAVHGRGLGTELAAGLMAIAFEGLGVRRVVAYCFADNVASWRIMRSLGMREEAHFVQDSLHRDGTWRDSLVHAMLAAEYADRMAD